MALDLEGSDTMLLQEYSYRCSCRNWIAACPHSGRFSSMQSQFWVELGWQLHAQSRWTQNHQTQQ